VTQSGGAGALVILEPVDLIGFAALRPKLTAEKVHDVHVAGASDAVLAVSLHLRMEDALRGAVAAVHGVTLRPTPWAKQQKSRVATVTVGQVKPEVLDAYAIAMSTLPTRVLARRVEESEDGEEDEEAGYFVVASALRGFVAENLARGRRWFAGFATATTTEKQPRYLHRYRTANDKLGALRAEDRKGLMEMSKQLDDAEGHLVRAVHVALRQRFGAIAEETKELPSQTRKNRFQGERDKWRLAFAGAKTREQVRGSLADLWGRAGTNSELQAHWKEILPLLRDDWCAARDLALVALASYQGKGVKDEGADDGEAAADAAQD
jgi:CRISPR-associated protein Cas8a1/Csx13